MDMKKTQFKKVKCSRCGKPAIVGFKFEDGIINACESCLIEVCMIEAANEEEKDNIIREMKEGAGVNGKI